MATDLSVAKTLIEYNSNSLESNNQEENALLDIELTEKNIGPENYENTIDF